MESTVKRLTRSDRERIFGGVCGGLAEYLGLDPALVRIVFVAITLVSGGFPGVLLYLVGWLVVPMAAPNQPAMRAASLSGKRVIAVTLLAVGLLGLVISIALNSDEANVLAYVGPVIVIAFAVYLLLRGGDSTANLNTYDSSSELGSLGEASRRRLRRSSRDKKIAGICGGFGEYFRVDPTLVRVLFILAAFTGTGLLVYLALWFIMPLDGDPDLAIPRN